MAPILGAREFHGNAGRFERFFQAGKHAAIRAGDRGGMMQRR
jgi:hypothetical protein